MTERDVVSYLLLHNLIDPEQIVSGHLSVSDVSRRHRNFKVTYNGGGLLVKQSTGTGKTRSLARDASILRHLEKQGPMSHYVPRVRASDDAEHIVVHELVVDAQDLSQYYFTRGHFPISLARSLGKAIATLHLSGHPTRENTTADSTARSRIPWVLSLQRPTLAFCSECSNANLQLVKIIQEFPSFGEHLDRLRAEWQPALLIHGDLKWDNILVFRRPAGARHSRINIIDWEFADIGDPCWDTGSVFGNYLYFWLMAMPLIGELASEHSVTMSRYPLERAMPSMRAFWESYALNMHLEVDRSTEWLLRSVGFAAVRLLQTAFEQMQDFIQPTSAAESMLQLSANILERPEEAAVHLFGFDPEFPFREPLP